ncbi:hypothetical protein ACJX0J_007675, partial [Zea mays]
TFREEDIISDNEVASINRLIYQAHLFWLELEGDRGGVQDNTATLDDNYIFSMSSFSRVLCCLIVLPLAIPILMFTNYSHVPIVKDHGTRELSICVYFVIIAVITDGLTIHDTRMFYGYFEYIVQAPLHHMHIREKNVTSFISMILLYLLPPYFYFL